MTTQQLEKLAARMSLIASLSDDALLSVKEFGEFLNRSKAAIYRDIRSGRIKPPIKIGNSSRWRVGYARSLSNGGV